MLVSIYLQNIWGPHFIYNLDHKNKTHDFERRRLLCLLGRSLGSSWKEASGGSLGERVGGQRRYQGEAGSYEK